MIQSGFEHKRARIDMLPLIDVVFLLLVFFIYAMISMVTYQDMPVSLPDVPGQSVTDGNNIRITLAKDGRIMVNNILQTKSTLSAAVQQAQQKTGDVPVLILADKAAAVEPAIEILQQMQTLGIAHVSFATKGGDTP